MSEVTGVDDEFFDVREVTYGDPVEHTLIVNAGPLKIEHIVPPAGEKYAFDRPYRTRRIEIYVSPTGRSVRVWVDGNEVQKHCT